MQRVALCSRVDKSDDAIAASDSISDYWNVIETCCSLGDPGSTIGKQEGNAETSLKQCHLSQTMSLCLAAISCLMPIPRVVFTAYMSLHIAATKSIVSLTAKVDNTACILSKVPSGTVSIAMSTFIDGIKQEHARNERTLGALKVEVEKAT